MSNGTPPVHYSPDGLFWWNGTQWIPTNAAIHPANRQTVPPIIRFGVPGIPVLLAIVLTLISPTYLQPFIASTGGLLMLGVVAVGIGAGWWMLNAAHSSGSHKILAFAIALVLAVIGLIIILIGPAFLHLAGICGSGASKYC